MSSYHFTFLSPWWLLLAALVPVVWRYSFRRLALLGTWRRVLALGLRSVVMLLVVLALADLQLVRTTDRLTVIYLLDQSLSIPPERRRAMIQYVNAAIRQHRPPRDRAGVIVFGRDAAIEIPPFDESVPMSTAIESRIDPESTNLAAAMRLAQGAFPEDAARRIVLISDGNQNQGDALEQARAMAGAAIGIDVVPVRYQRRKDVALERVVLPSDIRRGEPFDIKAVVTNTADPRDPGGGVISGRLEFRRLKDDQPLVLNPGPDQHVTLAPGKHVFSIRCQIDTPDFYTYEALFTPDVPEDDAVPQNNRATAFTHVRGRGQVLLIEYQQQRGQYDLLAERLRRQDLEVTVRCGQQAFSSLAELQPFDTVLLADVPREEFTDPQIQMLVRNTQQMGAGLIMIGGEHSFGAGGWTNTEMEEAMPVDFQVKNLKIIPRGALAMLMHASEIAQGNYWQKVIAREALQALGPNDLCGVLQWDSTPRWLWKPGLRPVGADRRSMLGVIDRMVPGDMPDFTSTMALARDGFAALNDVPVKHLIVISDGDPSPPLASLLAEFRRLKVTVSTVAVGAHGPAESQSMANIATATGGKSYVVNNPQSLPRIYQREARRIARPLVYENKDGFAPQISAAHEMLRGIDNPLPAIQGFVLTSRKENSLVETSIVSPKPADPASNTILASWTYGLGKAVAFTTDATQRWTGRWSSWENADKLFGQIVRWSMRPVSDAGKFTVATEAADGKVRVVISALDKKDQFLNFLGLSGTAIGPDLQPVSVPIEQTAPGRYVGTFPVPNAGSYFLALSPGPGQAPIRTGVNVAYSDEFRDRSTNEGLLEQLAAVRPEGASAGRVLPPLDEVTPPDTRLAVDSFRHDLARATSSQGVWYHLMLLAGCLFLADVFVRRVQVNFTWLVPFARRVIDVILRRQPPIPKSERIERLRNLKSEIAEQIEQQRVGTRFEPSSSTSGESDPGKAPLGPVQQPPLLKPPPQASPTLSSPPPAEGESYTARLLRAKRHVWEDRQDGGSESGEPRH